MNKSMNTFWDTVKYTIFLAVLLMAFLVAATCLWICVTPYQFGSLGDLIGAMHCVVKNIGSYALVLTAVIGAVVFRGYCREKESEAEEAAKLREAGSYTLAFGYPEVGFNEKFTGEKMVVEITESYSYNFAVANEEPYLSPSYVSFPIKFLTSKQKSSNLKNVMIFGDRYFRRNRIGILKNYYRYCERITYTSPLYCAAKPIREEKETAAVNKKRYFWVVTKAQKPEETKVFWVSAVTEEGVLLFIRVKADIENDDLGTRVTLLQQTTYYKNQNKLCPVVT